MVEWWVHLFTVFFVAIIYKFFTSVMKEQMNMNGKVVVITGASSGIGKEMAIQLAIQGAKVVLAARRSEELQAVVAECEKEGAKAVSLVADVTKEDECKAVVDLAVKEFGGIDVVVLNAGISMGSLFEDVTDLSIFPRLMDVNYMGCVNMAHAALPHLKTSKGRIGVVSSMAGVLGTPTRTGYCASKWALHGFFSALRNEVSKYGIKVTLLCPGPVQTDINNSRLIGHEGKVTADIDMSKAQPVSDAVSMMIRGIKKGEREVLWSPIEPVLFRLLQAVAPGVVDSLILKEFQKMTQQ